MKFINLSYFQKCIVLVYLSSSLHVRSRVCLYLIYSIFHITEDDIISPRGKGQSYMKMKMVILKENRNFVESH